MTDPPDPFQPLPSWHHLSWNELRADQRRRVTTAARQLLVQGGWDAMTLQAVSTRARVSKTDVYLVIESREQLAADAYTDAAHGFLQAGRTRRTDPRSDPVAAAISAIVDLAASEPERAALVLDEPTPPGQPFRLARVHTLDTFADQLHRCHAHGVDPLQARLICGGLLHHLADHRRDTPPATLADELTRLCHAMLGDPTGPGTPL